MNKQASNEGRDIVALATEYADGMSATVLECEHDARPSCPDPRTGVPVFPGYGVERGTGRRLCYDCCDAIDRDCVRSAAVGDRWFGYLSRDARTVGTWSGGAVMGSVTVGGDHPWSLERHYVSAVDELGRVWSGTAAPGMWASLRLTRKVVTR